jgi:hypothetical protein
MSENKNDEKRKIKIYCWSLYLLSITITISIWIFFIYRINIQTFPIEATPYPQDIAGNIFGTLILTYYMIFLTLIIFNYKIGKRIINIWLILFLFLVLLYFVILGLEFWIRGYEIIKFDSSIINEGTKNASILFIVDMFLKSIVMLGLFEPKSDIANNSNKQIKFGIPIPSSKTEPKSPDQ